jgi:imidazolonepropionase-like amidohydrolase
MLKVTRLTLTLLLAAPAVCAQDVDPGAVGGKGLAIFSKKVVTCEFRGRATVDNGVVLVKDGKIEAVGARRDTLIPSGYEVLDVGDNWLMPGLVEMHCHVAGQFGLNDMVYLANPGLRASADVTPGNPLLRVGLAAGVTSVLYIPGSGTNVGGQGVLLRTGYDHYEDAEIRNPGSMKLAQAGNPERWLTRPNRSFMNWNTRTTFKKGISYAQQWEAYERDGGVQPRKDPQWEIFRHLRKRDCHISTHTQIYQVILKTITMVHDELGLPFFIDHGTFDSWRVAALAEERGIFACLGPRGIDVPTRGFINWSGSNPERIQGVAAGYQELGHSRIGFNTDSPVIPQEELQLQAAMGVRYGFDDSNMDHLRGLTIVPAMAGGIGDSVGSIEVGKDADLLVVTGDIADPRASVELVLQQGNVVYDPETEGRRW